MTSAGTTLLEAPGTHFNNVERRSPAIVSFVIPARNEERFLGRCLDSILAQQGVSELRQVEIIVVDNESTDQTAHIGRARGARIVTVPPGSVSRARNAGATVTNGDWLAFIDADCELSSDWLMHCVQTAEQENAIAVGSPMALPGCDASWVERMWFVLALQAKGESMLVVDWLPTFNLLVRADEFQRIGGFDESLVTCEDVDLGYRLARRGRLIRNQQTHAVHHGESKTISEFFCREAWRSRGNLAGALRRGPAPGEWLSLIIPPLTVTLATIGLLSAIAAMATGRQQWPGWLSFILGAVVPALIVVRRIDFHGGMLLKRCILGYILATVYLMARTYGLIAAAKRVERSMPQVRTGLPNEDRRHAYSR